MSRIETTILSNLLHDEDYSRKVIPFLKKEYFSDNIEAIVAEEIFKFFEVFTKLATPEILSIEISNRRDINDSQLVDAHQLIDALVHTEINATWLLNETESFCKQRAVYLAILDSIQIIDGKDKQYTQEAIPTLLSDALSVCFDTNVGHDYFHDSDERFDFYRRVEEKIPFDIEILNKITAGGLSRKSLNILLAGTGVGKSLVMCHFAASALSQGKNVLYITMEMAEERIAERIDVNLLNLGMNEIKTIDKNIFDSRIQKLRKKAQGTLIIKEYPTASAHAGHFRALIEELKSKKDFAPDIIFVDYLNICASQRMKFGAGVNSYTYVKAIAEELRGLAVEYNVPLVSATQSNREGINSSDLDLTNTSESIGLPQTCDLMLALISTEELEELGQIMIKQLKNRYNDPSYYKKFVVGIDRNKMRIFDVENSAQETIVIPQDSQSLIQRGGRVMPDTSGFKF
jgi:replicative DNA helicase